MCARVDTSGSVVDSLGIEVPGRQYPGGVLRRDPSVAFDGVNYLVIWEAECSTWGMDNIDGARINTSGAVVDSAARTIVPGYWHKKLPDIAFDGEHYLVVWEDIEESLYYHDIYGVLVDTSRVSHGTLLPICTVSGDKYSPDVAFNGVNYFVVFERFTGVYGARVTTSGTILDPSPIAICDATGKQVSPAVASDGSQYLVAWEDWRSGLNSTIYFGRVGGDGTIQDPGGKPISTLPGCQVSPAVAFDGPDFVVAWTDSGSVPPDLRMSRVTASGLVLDPTGVTIGAPGDLRVRPAIALCANKGVVAWEDSSRACLHGIRAIGLDLPGLVVDHELVQVSRILNEQLNPSVAFDGFNYFAVWEDSRGVCGRGIYGARVDVSGAAIDPCGIKISTSEGDRQRPSVAFDGNHYLVVWEERQGDSASIVGVRVSTAGSVLDPGGILISVSGAWLPGPAVVYNGVCFLVVWADGRSGTDHIYAARIDTSGAVLDPYGLPVFLDQDQQSHPSIACDGTDCLVVWTFNGIRGLRLDNSGNVLGSEIEIWSPSTAYDCAVDFGASQYMVVWTGYQNFNPYGVYGARVSTSGILQDAYPIQISDAGPNNGSVAVAFDGTDHLVVWGSYGPVTGARVDPSGTVLDPQGFEICAVGYGYSCPSLCRGQNRGLLVAYSAPDSLGAMLSNYIDGRIWRGPTGLVFASASATGIQEYVTLSWEMEIAASAADFIVERSDKQDGEFSKLDLEVFRRSAVSFFCHDYSAVGGKTYWYRILLVSPSGEAESYGPIEVRVNAVPTVYAAYQSYPNPFNPVCTIRYDIPRPSKVSLRVFDVGGSVVRTLVDSWREPGVYRDVWDGKSDDGRELPSGVYFYSLKAGDFAATRKMVLLK